MTVFPKQKTNPSDKSTVRFQIKNEAFKASFFYCVFIGSLSNVSASDRGSSYELLTKESSILEGSPKDYSIYRTFDNLLADDSNNNIYSSGVFRLFNNGDVEKPEKGQAHIYFLRNNFISDATAIPNVGYKLSDPNDYELRDEITSDNSVTSHRFDMIRLLLRVDFILRNSVAGETDAWSDYVIAFTPGASLLKYNDHGDVEDDQFNYERFFNSLIGAFLLPCTALKGSDLNKSILFYKDYIDLAGVKYYINDSSNSHQATVSMVLPFYRESDDN